MVEFALIVPLFFFVLFGVIEVGWFFSQQVEVRNAAREGARLAVVDFADTATMRSLVCDRASLAGDRASTRFELVTVVTGSSQPDTARVVVEQAYASITGGFIPGFDGRAVTSTVEMRLEQSIENWVSDGSLEACAP